MDTVVYKGIAQNVCLNKGWFQNVSYVLFNVFHHFQYLPFAICVPWRAKAAQGRVAQGCENVRNQSRWNCMYTNMYHLISPSPAIWIHMGVSEHGLCPKTIQKHGFTTTIQMLKFRWFGVSLLETSISCHHPATTVEHLSHLLLFVDVIRHGFGIGDLLLSKDQVTSSHSVTIYDNGDVMGIWMIRWVREWHQPSSCFKATWPILRYPARTCWLGPYGIV